MEVKAAHLRRRRQGVQIGQLVGGLDQAAGRGHPGRLALGQRRLGGPAALAGPEARALGVGARGVKGHVLAPGLAGGAGRPAVHPGGAHGVIEPAVGSGIAHQYRRPAGRVGPVGGIADRGSRARG
jgi:hypothetical protein